MNGESVGVAGVGVRLPCAADAGQLAARLALRREVRLVHRRFALPGARTAVADGQVGLCSAPAAPGRGRTAGAAAPGGGGEVTHALAAARAALEAAGRGGGAVAGRTATVWATSTAGLEEYAALCSELASAGAGPVSPLRAARSAFTGCATALSVALSLEGPYLNLAGDRDAGAHALFEAARLLVRGEAARAVVGASAGVSGWRLAADRAAAGHSEGAVCLVLGGADTVGNEVARIRPLIRSADVASGSDAALESFLRSCLAAMERPPEMVALSTGAGGGAVAAVVSRVCGVPCHRIEEVAGDLGAAGGAAALAACAAASAEPGLPVRSLVLAVGAGGAAGIEVISAKRGRL